MRRHPHGRPEREPTSDMRWLLIFALGFAFALCSAPPANATTHAVTDVSYTAPTNASDSYCYSPFFATLTLASLWGTWFGRHWNREIKEPGRIITSMFPNTRALVVDHRLPNRRQLRQRLEAFEIRVDEEINGSRGVDRVLNDSFDIVFLAPNLPILNSHVVCRILQQARVAAKIVVVGSEENSDNAVIDRDHDSLAEPIELGQLELLLTRTLPHQQVDSIVPVMDQSLRDMQRAVDIEDFQQAASLAQRMRELGNQLDSQPLLAAIDRLEAFLEDDDAELPQIEQLQSTLQELGTLLQTAQDGRGTQTSSPSPRVKS